MKNLFVIILLLLTAASCTAQYDPPSGYTTRYQLRMWDEGDRPGADSVNQNLKDIDAAIWNIYRLHTDSTVRLSNNQTISGAKTFLSRSILTGGTTSGTGNHFVNRNDFMTEAPYAPSPSTEYQLANKLYVDGAITTASSDYVKLTGAQVIHDTKTFLTDSTVFGGDEIGTIKLSLYGTDAAQLKFNGATFLSWATGVLSVSGALDATGYKLNGTPMNLTSNYGEKTLQDVYVSSTSGGVTNKQLHTVAVTINGVTYNILIDD